MERTQTKVGRVLVERARERAHEEGREEFDVIEDALKLHLDGEETFGEILSTRWPSGNANTAWSLSPRRRR